MAAKINMVWSNCLERISDLVPKYSYNTWIRPLRPVSLDERNGKVLHIEVPNLFHQKWIEENYYDIVGNSIREVLGPHAALTLSLPIPSDTQTDSQTQFNVITSSERTSHPPQRQPVPHQLIAGQPKTQYSPAPNPPTSSTPRPQSTSTLNLNDHYTFEELVEGEGNRIARSAGMAIAKNPGSTSFNPLFMYGDVGLGKTHLAQAICQYAIKHGTARNPIYITIDDFTNQFISSIRSNRCHAFTSYFRQADLLVVDDIQFLSGKERTQEEFFHLFNAIHHSGGQIVLCADRSPSGISGVHNRLISRFQWGLTTDIKAPDLSTRIAIVEKKAQRYKIKLSDEIAEKIACAVQRNVRELESVLTKILAHSSLHNAPISLNLAEQVLQQYGGPISTLITIDEIIAVVAETFDTRPEYIVGKSRKREIVLARHAAMYLAKEFTNHSLKSIGLHFAGRDHSTVIHAVKQVDARMETEASFSSRLKHAEKTVQERVDGLRNNMATFNSDRN